MTGNKTPPAPFEAPWHGQAFALTVAMNEAGHFSWPEWVTLFSATLKKARLNGPLNGSNDYYIAWISALEAMLLAKGIADTDLLSEMKANWHSAFLATPHGKPVHPALPKRL